MLTVFVEDFFGICFFKFLDNFTVTFDLFKAYLLNKTITSFFQKKNWMVLKNIYMWNCWCIGCFVFQDGAILVFLPGWDNISTLNDLLVADQMFKSGRLYINIYFLKFPFTKWPSYYAFKTYHIYQCIFIKLETSINCFFCFVFLW